VIVVGAEKSTLCAEWWSSHKRRTI